MTDKQLIDKFLKLHEQSEQVTDEQLRQALDDEQMRELAEQMAFAKRAFKNEEVDVPSVDEAWAKFEAAHPSPRAFRKVAAIFTGLVVASGIAFAGFHAVRSTKAPEMQSAQMTAATPLTGDTLRTDTTAEAHRVFNNVTLEKMLTEIATAHHIRVTFQNEAARQLRFHFVWKCDDNLSRTVEKLNTFEAIDIVVENETLVVR